MKRDLYLKTTALILAVVMIFVFAGCGSNDTDEKTVAEILCTEFQNVTSERDPLSIMGALSENDVISFSPVVSEVSEGYLPGFDNDIVGFSKAATLMPMIGSIPFAAYCFETENASDLKKLLEDSVKLDWNICTVADEYQIEVSDNLVFMVLSPFEL